MTKWHGYDVGYDNYGNVISKSIAGFEYNNKNMLSSYGVQGLGLYLPTYHFYYNCQGVRCKKTQLQAPTTSTVNYITDGSKILEEHRSDGRVLKYYYDAIGITGLETVIDGVSKTYWYIKDAEGNILRIVDKDRRTWAKYNYTAWGECEVIGYDQNGAEITVDSNHIAKLNPFIYKLRNTKTKQIYKNQRQTQYKMMIIIKKAIGKRWLFSIYGFIPYSLKGVTPSYFFGYSSILR